MDETRQGSQNAGRAKTRGTTSTTQQDVPPINPPASVSSGTGASTDWQSSAERGDASPHGSQSTSSSVETRREAGNVSTGLMDRMKDRAASQLSTQKDRATEGIDSVAQAVRKTTQELRQGHHETVADYVERAADQLELLSTRLQNKDLGELMRDAQRLARRQPAMFIGTAFMLGLVGARFMKSSPEPHAGYQPDWHRGPHSSAGAPAVTGGTAGRSGPSLTERM